MALTGTEIASIVISVAAVLLLIAVLVVVIKQYTKKCSKTTCTHDNSSPPAVQLAQAAAATSSSLCTPMTTRPTYNKFLTWYGVQTVGVVDAQMYAANVDTILKYAAASNAKYTHAPYNGFLFQLDDPPPANIKNGSPPN